MDLTTRNAGHDLSGPGALSPEFQFLKLPLEIQVQFPIHLGDIEDFMHLSSTCRYLSKLYSTTSPNTIFQLAAASSHPVFKPGPHLLITAVAKQVGEWALQSPRRRLAFHNSFQTNGIEGLFELCQQVGRLTMQEIRELREIKHSVLDPIAFEISKECGPLSTNEPSRGEPGWSGELTICENPYVSLLQMTMFGDFFAANIRAVYDTQVTNPLSPSIRRDWWSNCCPDVNCADSPRADADQLCHLDMRSLHNVFCSEVWNNGWSRAVERLTEKLPEELQPLPASLFQTPETYTQFGVQQAREGFWEQTVKGQGLRGMHLLLYGGIADIPEELVETRKKILGMHVDHIDPKLDKRSDAAWKYRVAPRSDVYACLDWV